MIVDAPNTAYALQAKKILRMNGLQDSDYTVKTVGGTLFRYRAMREDKSHAASMLNPPFSIDAPGAGLKSLGRAVDLIGPYQATGAWVLRKWAAANAETLERYIAAFIESTRWAVTPANKDAAAKMLAERFKLQPDVAARTWDLLADPKFGLAADGTFNEAGFRNVLALRAEIEGDWGGKPPADRALSSTSATTRRRSTASGIDVKVVDVHTHMLNEEFLKLLRKHGGGYKVKKVVGGQTGIFKDGAPFMTLMPGMFDYDLRIQAMDAAGVDIAIVTLTSPNVYWGSPKISLEASKIINDDMARAAADATRRASASCARCPGSTRSSRLPS